MELLVVIGIIALLTGMIVPCLGKNQIDRQTDGLPVESPFRGDCLSDVS